MSQITGAGFASGAVGAGLNEALIKSLKAKTLPLPKELVLFIGAAAAKAVNRNAAVGASAKDYIAHAWHIIIEYVDFLSDLIYKSKSMSNSIIS